MNKARPAAHAGNLLPTGFFQKFMIAAACDPKTTDLFNQHFTVRWGFRLSPSVSARTLRRVFDKLVSRHESLRLRFVSVNSEWRAEIMPKHPDGLRVEDLSGVSEDAQNSAIRAWANAPMTAFCEPMFEMCLFKCGPQGDVVVLRAHHAIIDGYSIIVLIEELLKLALNLPVPRHAVSHAEFVQPLEQQKAQNEEKNDLFWQDRLLPAPPPLQIGRVARNMPPISRRNVGETHTLDNILSGPESQRLEGFAKQAGVTAFACVHAAFSETICALGGQDDVLICSWLGRQSGNLQNFVGSETQLIAQIYHRDGADLACKARQVAMANQECVQNLPSDALLPDGPLAAKLAEKGVTLWRFAVHNSFPWGRLSSSPFQKLFSKGLTDKVSLGFMSFERVDFPDPCDAEFEIFVRVNHLPSGPNVTIAADAAAFEHAEIEQIANLMKQRLMCADEALSMKVSV